MEHFYKKIHGWFDYQDIYSDVVRNAEDGFHFVEIGTWFGRSTSYMAVEIINSGKKIKFDTIDNWNFIKEDKDYIDYINHIKSNKIDNPRIKFLMNIEKVQSYVNSINGSSTDISKFYKNESLNFVFIDGNHDYENTKNDIFHWLPKIKQNGIIAGHDYTYPGVRKAVNEFFSDGVLNNFEIRGSSWLHIKKLEKKYEV
jgi:hypothetical protein